MSASQRVMEPEPNEKTISVHFVANIGDPYAATIVFPRYMSVRRSEFRIRQGREATVRISKGQFRFYVDTLFPGSSDAVRVSANVIGAQVHSLRIEQDHPYSVVIDIRHTDTAPTEYCTVTCEATGESRTGIGACIDCRGPKGTVRLCC